MSDVKFIRINGRIVPIRKGGAQSKPSKGSSGKSNVTDVVAGSTAIGAGVATGYIGGKFAAKQLHSAAKLENIARQALRTSRQYSKVIINGYEKIPLNKLEQYGRISANSALKGMTAQIQSLKHFGNAQGLRLGGIIAAGTLVGHGVSKIFDGLNLKGRSRDLDQAASVTSGIAAGLLVNSAYYKPLMGGKGHAANAIKLAFKRVVLKK